MIYITGDTHGDFTRALRLCKDHSLCKTRDVLIVLGDAGINYFGDNRDMALKMALSRLTLTIFCIHGNHEIRPQTIPSYTETTWRGGKVYVEPDYPSLLFAKDGEIFELDDVRAIVIGGAYSVDKYHRLEKGWRWFADEQPSEEIQKQFEGKLDGENWKIDVVLSHTCPLKYGPVEVFLPVVDQSTVDKSTETWLDSIENRLAYDYWFCGHYHTEKRIDRLQLLYRNILPFQGKEK